MAKREAVRFGRALVVDDSGLVALDTQELLLELGFDSVSVAAGDDEALASIAAGPLAFALLDGSFRGGDLGVLIAALDRAAVPLALICDAPDGSDLSVLRAGRAFLARPFSRHDLARLLLRARR